MKSDNSEFRKIMKRIAGGDKTALADFSAIYGKLIYVTARRFCVSEDLVDEAVDDVLIKVWHAADIIKDYEYIEAWLVDVTANEIKNLIKRQGDKKDPDTTEENDLAASDSRDAFNYYIKDLSESEQEIITYKFVRRLTFEDISRMTGTDPGAISSVYYRAIEKIKQNKKLRR